MTLSFSFNLFTNKVVTPAVRAHHKIATIIIVVYWFLYFSFALPCPYTFGFIFWSHSVFKTPAAH